MEDGCGVEDSCRPVMSSPDPGMLIMEEGGGVRAHRTGRYFGVMNIVEHIQEFIENETQSRFMKFGCITQLYVISMWGGRVAIEDISTAVETLKVHG